MLTAETESCGQSETQATSTSTGRYFQPQVWYLLLAGPAPIPPVDPRGDHESAMALPMDGPDTNLQELMASPKGFLPRAVCPSSPSKVTGIREPAMQTHRISIAGGTSPYPISGPPWAGILQLLWPKEALPQCYVPAASLCSSLSPLPAWGAAGWARRGAQLWSGSTSGGRVTEARAGSQRSSRESHQAVHGAPSCQLSSAQPTAFRAPAWDQLAPEGDSWVSLKGEIT